MTVLRTIAWTTLAAALVAAVVLSRDTGLTRDAVIHLTAGF